MTKKLTPTELENLAKFLKASEDRRGAPCNLEFAREMISDWEPDRLVEEYESIRHIFEKEENEVS